MNLLLVTFSLRNLENNYDQFFVELRGNALQWWHYIEQTCVVATFLSAEDFSKKLTPHILPTDSLLVAKLEPFEFQGWLPKEAWEWLHGVSESITSSKYSLLLPSVSPPSLPALPKVIPPPPSVDRTSDFMKALAKILAEKRSGKP